MTQKKILENIFETNMTQTQITPTVTTTEEDDVTHHQATKTAAAGEIKEMKIQKQQEKEKKFKAEMTSKK